MHRVRLVFVGDLKARWAQEACRHYQEALARFVRVETAVVRDARESRDVPARLRKEGQALLAALGPRERVVGLEIEGEAPGSEGLARQLGRWLDDPGRMPCFVVGGPYGFGVEARARFDHRLSLGPCTLPHELARVVLLEQLYRAMSILAGHPYHHG
ncbi:Ribosomal RNA large subunit methyltransferase H [Fundidesulfovibrio magnetotacticus]|uniref:Ribosomal RNA large subunit methyltransferase H n=1 Tax=Fundidesulfovibrio magnetotacticus TaxID=2730080 RepID=A0A6V8LYZ0_9BACT|nr:23S rRNA (pseudouridine(1915)-N(3))-methyltransferase RlmH [Fundidesulfovibrio magnetotacticus]GFK95006.1 Ribosomal RNA large subunit methyltransferase H [Fundidesulfovibrio magnetotacticus]